MFFPVFEMPWLGDRWLIGSMAILHVLINHAAAIGGSLMLVALEHRGRKLGDERWDVLAYRLAFVYFVLVTTVGALTGVGIWFTTMVAEPAGIGTMLRIFFWGWFAEWLVFVLEVVMVMAYFLSWKVMRPQTHLKLGYAYAISSAATMAIITGILSSMLTPGHWLIHHGFWDGFLNPSYPPQLLLRSGLALGLGAGLSMLLSRWLAPEDLRAEASRFLARFLLASVPLAAIGGAWYLAVLPDQVRDLIPTALMTTQFAPYVQDSYLANGLIAVAVLAVGFWALKRHKPLPTAAVFVPFLALVMLLGQFERVREFVRKPYLIPGYLYANGIRVDAVPELNKTGVLAQAPYAAVHTVTPANRLLAGREVYRLECAECHTIGGLNDLRAKTAGKSPEAIDGFVAHLHDIHPFMPPFVGTDAERQALAAYLSSLSTPVAKTTERAHGG
ncbi:MAG TPA: cytochrome c [Oscillatoriaceae cyanobacterium]